jgi:hypothetical protein
MHGSHDFKTDVNRFKYAEEKVLSELRRRYGFSAVLDIRHKHTHGDFLAYMGTKDAKLIDVKTDTYIPQYTNIVWEWKSVGRSGAESDGWGLDESLDYLAEYIVQLGEIWLVDAGIVRQLAALPLADGKVQVVRNAGGYDSYWVKVPIVELEKAGGFLWRRAIE